MLFQNTYQYPIQPSMTTNKMLYQPPATTCKSNISNVPLVPLKTAFASKVLWIALPIVIVLGLTAATTVPIIVMILTSETTTTTTTSDTTTTAACATTYSQFFTSGATPSSECTTWNSFVAGLTCSSPHIFKFVWYK
ncbi:unnamed protein product [Rotaria socialis]|uniref:Uncharacterized protein n=1 Tax=Rotaria socialis TaxID=392032 RepID=A0A821C8C2_9BILA|nr:unnamed protein product [Rotaria socialis]CAF4604815.1 unnamed protein product [Rotaria socialis]